MKMLTCSGITALLLFVIAGCGGQEAAQDMPAADGMSVDTTEELGATAEELTFETELTGDAEVPGPGDPDGIGAAVVNISPAEGTVCYEITVENIAEAQAAHIHTGAAGESGPPVVDFDVASNDLSGCVDAEEDVIQSIIEAPSNYYVNVHNEEYGAGAVRGQLGGSM